MGLEDNEKAIKELARIGKEVEGDFEREEQERTQKINKLIKPYIVRRKNGYCSLLIPIGEWDKLLETIHDIFVEYDDDWDGHLS